jgi:glycerophosphoryl diester phosphodiesterase
MDSSALNPLGWSSEPFIVLLILVLLLRLRFSDPSSRLQRITTETLAIGPAVLLYFLVRGFVNARFDDASANAQRIIDLEKSLGIYREEEFQDLVLGSDAIVTAVNWVYIWGHWPVIAGVMIWLVVWRPDEYARYRNALILAGALSMVIFALYPVTPPRLMEGMVYVDTVTDRSQSYRVLQPPGLTNPYAAMPSLHFGWNLLMGIAIVQHTRHWGSRLFGMLMPLAMFLAIVLTANHYILDGVAGAAIVLVSLCLVSGATTFGGRWWRRRPGPGTVETVALEQSPAYLSQLPGHRPLIVAHRAGNNLSRLIEAELHGADIVEADVWLYRGRLEVRHTKTLGPLPILWDRWSIHSARAPRLLLCELLEAAGPETLLMLDIKGRNAEIAHRVIAELREDFAGRQVMVCSQNWDLLKPFDRYRPAIVVHSIGNQWQLRQAWDHLASEHCQALSIQFQLLDRESVHLLKERVPLVLSWAINSSQQMQTVIDWGLDGAITDDLTLIAGLERTPQTV